MEIKTKFSPDETAYFFKSATEIHLIKIKSIETRSQSKGNKVTYISEEEKEFSEIDLLTAREVTKRINGY